MATPILIFWAAWAGILPSPMAITTITGIKNFLSFISFIFSFSGGLLRNAERSSRNLRQRRRKKRLLLEKFPSNFFWGFNSLFDGRIANDATGNQRGNNAQKLVPPLNLVENFCDEFGAKVTRRPVYVPRLRGGFSPVEDQVTEPLEGNTCSMAFNTAFSSSDGKLISSFSPPCAACA
jgi:hypothetical protein